MSRHRYLPPPPPQDADSRAFQKGDRVRAHMTFSHGCPPGPNKVWEGTCGTVTASPVLRDDRPFNEFNEWIRMVPVKWDDGVVGEVIDRLLEKEETTH